MFFKFSQNLQEKTFLGVSSLIKLQAQPKNFIKVETLERVCSCELCEILKSIYVCRTSTTGCSSIYSWVLPTISQIVILLHFLVIQNYRESDWLVNLPQVCIFSDPETFFISHILFFISHFFGLFSWLRSLCYIYLLTILSKWDLCTVSTKSSITKFLEVMYWK